MKNRQSVFCTIAATNNRMEGMAGIGWIGAAGGGPVVNAGSKEILFLSMYH
jgi:hypothetical protein